MTGRFADAASRHAGSAARLLGWRPADFWNATPAELALSLADPEAETAPVTRAEIERMMERDCDG